MLLFLVHAGFYDEGLHGGVYETHTNFLIAADNIQQAKIKVNQDPSFKSKKMHIDSIQEIRSVMGYDIQLVKNGKSTENDVQAYMGANLRRLAEN